MTEIMRGHIFQINSSNGGVPKLAMQEAEVTFEGIVGDQQNNKKVHGGPKRALCLYSVERILALQSEGHPIYPGSIGENVTVAGLNWEKVIPRSKLNLGEEVLIEITGYTTPCYKITAAFLDGDSGRISDEQYPGWSRVYASVLKTGLIKVGDRVRFNG